MSLREADIKEAKQRRKGIGNGRRAEIGEVPEL
jgi:hypothetical protein